jgi:hypothetical protein
LRARGGALGLRLSRVRLLLGLVGGVLRLRRGLLGLVLPLGRLVYRLKSTGVYASLLTAHPAARLRRAMLIAEFPFDVVEVKLAAPPILPGTVAKADAIARLCSSRSTLATVVAPAGYGKTTLLARWGRG